MNQSHAHLILFGEANRRTLAAQRLERRDETTLGGSLQTVLDILREEDREKILLKIEVR